MSCVMHQDSSCLCVHVSCHPSGFRFVHVGFNGVNFALFESKWSSVGDLSFATERAKRES